MTALPRRTPHAHGLPARAALDFLDTLQESGQDPHALQLARDGAVVLEASWAPHRGESPALVYSVSKTWTALAIGFLVAEGRLDLHARLSDVLGLPANPLTIHHLLTMNTGHSAEQLPEIGFDATRLLQVEPEHTPGSHFVYNSPATFALSQMVTHLTGEDLTAYLQPRLLDPLGIPARWMRHAHGVEQGFSGYHLAVEDITRITLALASGGRFQGRQVVPAEYVEALARPWSANRDPEAPAPTEGEPPNDWWLGYGYQVWRNRVGFRLDGAYGQFGLVLPEHGITLAYQGATTETHHILNAFWALLEKWDEEEVPGSDAERAAASELAKRVATLDSWDTRDSRLFLPEVAASGESVDVAGWELREAGSGWELTLPPSTTPDGTAPGGVLPVRADRWSTTLLAQDGPPDTPCALALAARAEELDGGVLVVEIADLTSPHRIELRRDSDGSLAARWHTTPLWRASLATLIVPLEVARQAAG
ncbi:serine hydrolase domain-containing protein [Bogoriella caseilytica]|uniref:CubicO group peptidase (Beta-lactamase class C family) n=1 Tax=Bogoriella caseilytica TaxID=56055 RepID=A0A3N2BE11_9MICO|nr:serine hydrolase domain-containing protein [Bogoriella caseilytica]ROR73465.1 CubicO group peptidase (beta-lactamase class C family) [Bogoriella caseilytica]